MMTVKTLMSAGLLALSGAAIAQVTTAPDPKLGSTPAGDNAQADHGAAPMDNAVDNASDPGKR